MSVYLIGVGIIGIGLGLGILVYRHAGHLARDLEARLRAGPPPLSARVGVPEPVRRLAERAGAGQEALAKFVVLTQAAELRMARGGAWSPLRARQVIATGTAGFLWEATQPMLSVLSKITIVDAYVQGKGRLQARLFGLITVADAQGAALDLGEAMRYLAEIVWAPDAVLANLELRWRVVRENLIEVSLPAAGASAVVALHLDGTGNITEITATARPSREASGETVLRDWRGRFGDYRDMGGRRIPTSAEVGYDYAEGYEAYWRGRIVSYAIER